MCRRIDKRGDRKQNCCQEGKSDKYPAQQLGDTEGRAFPDLPAPDAPIAAKDDAGERKAQQPPRDPEAIRATIIKREETR